MLSGFINLFPSPRSTAAGCSFRDDSYIHHNAFAQSHFHSLHFHQFSKFSTLSRLEASHFIPPRPQYNNRANALHRLTPLDRPCDSTENVPQTIS